MSRRREKKSSVWKHFKEEDKDLNKAQCKHCSKIVSIQPTTNMWRHITKSHPSLVSDKDIGSKLQSNSDSKMQQVELTNELKLSKTIQMKPKQITLGKQNEMDNALVSFMTGSPQPFNLVGNKEFQELLSCALPGYILPSRSKFDELLAKRFKEKNEQLKELCQNARNVSYTADMWKSAANQYYLSIAVHFVDNNWKLNSVLITTTHVQGSHKKDIIGNIIHAKIAPFLGQNTKIHSGITDGGELASVKHTDESFPKSQKYLQKIEARHCICHILNNAVKRILNSYFKDYLVEWRAFIGHINHSNPFNELFNQCKKKVFGEKDKQKIQRDCETRYL